MARTGRPTKLDAERARQIVEKVANGVPPEVAAASCGVSRTAFYAWKARGQRSRVGVFRDFAEGLERAVADAEQAAVGQIKAAALGGAIVRRVVTRTKDGRELVDETYTRPEWTAAAWYLERAHRDRWGRTDRVDLRVLSEQVAGDEGLTDVERDQLQQELASFLRTNR